MPLIIWTIESYFGVLILLFVLFILPSIIRGLLRKKDDYPSTWTRYFNDGKPFRLGGIVLLLFGIFGVIGYLLDNFSAIQGGALSLYSISFSILPSAMAAIIGFFSHNCFKKERQNIGVAEKETSVISVPTEIKPSLQENPAKTCKNCGEQLFPEWVFCNKCGQPVEKEDNDNSDYLAVSTAKTEDGIDYSRLEQSDKTNDNLARQDDRTDISALDAYGELNIGSLPPKLRRAFILVEDEEWEKADEYFEGILDAEPENAYAYLGKALIQVKVNSPAKLSCEEIQAVCKTKYYSRAKKYADEELKRILERW